MLNKKLKILLLPWLALFGLAVLVAVAFRAFSIKKEEAKEGDFLVQARSLARYLWLELKSVLKFSRF